MGAKPPGFAEVMPSGRRKSVPSDQWQRFYHIASVFKEAASISQEFEYWNAAGVLIAHAAIALTDALTVKVGGVKARSEDHFQTGQLVQETVALDADGKRALRHFYSIIEHKSLVSYSGTIYRRKDILSLMKHLERYQKWVEGIIKS